MANRLEGTSTFSYEGQDYRLTLNNRVLLDAETVLGYSALDAAEEAKQAMAVGRNPMLRTVVALFYGALVQSHPGVSQDEAIDMFMGDNPGPQKAFKEVLLGTEPAKVGNGQRAPQAPAKKPRGTGRKSTKPTGGRATRAKTSG